MLIEVENARFGYGTRAVVEVSRLELRAGRCMGIFGPNGAGKTTMIRGVAGLLPPLSGNVRRRDSIRFGYMPQHRTLDRHWPMNGLDAASMALSARRRLGWMGHDIARVREAMRALSVDDLATRSFAKLSGGQQQRLLLAGALATEPDVLVLDEPTDGLDVRSRQLLLDLLREQTVEGLCTVIISHEVEDLLAVADEIAWLHRPDDPQRPSQVEIIVPDQFVDRVAHARAARI